MTDPITIRAFRAIDEPDTCQNFFDGHVNVLKSYGLEPISSSKKEWFNNSCVYGVIAEIDKKVVGGVKIHGVDGKNLLPVEESVGYKDERLFDIVKTYANNGGAGEACGLWNSREVSGWGLSLIMMKSIVSICNQIEMNTLFGLSSDHTIKLFQSLGYHVIKSLGKNGDFVYPTPEYLARVIIMNTLTLDGADTYNRDVILDLRKTPEQVKFEKTKKGNLKVVYKLSL